jgi:hypothetical protein
VKITHNCQQLLLQIHPESQWVIIGTLVALTGTELVTTIFELHLELRCKNNFEFPAAPLRFERHHDIFPSWPAPPGLASGIRADQRSSKMASVRIMFRLLFTASDRVAKRAGFCVDCWLRSLPETPLRFEPHHDVIPSWPAPPGLASGIRADQRSSKINYGGMFDLVYTASERVAKRAGFCMQTQTQTLQVAALNLRERNLQQESSWSNPHL